MDTRPLTSPAPFEDFPAAPGTDALWPEPPREPRDYQVLVTAPLDQGRGRMFPGLPPAETADPDEQVRITIPVRATGWAQAVAMVLDGFAGRSVTEVTVRLLAF